MSLRVSGSTRYSEEFVARAVGNVVLYKGMATSIGQYAPVFLTGESPSLKDKPGRPQSTGSQTQILPKQLCTHKCKTFFACDSSAPVRAEDEGSTAAWLAGTLAAGVQGHGLPLPQELWPYQNLSFKLLVAGDQKASLASLSLKPRPFRHLEGFLPGVLLCCSAHQAHRGSTADAPSSVSLPFGQFAS